MNNEHGNGWTKDGQVSKDYRDAGRDPDLPRPSPEQIQKTVHNMLIKPDVTVNQETAPAK